MPNGMPMTKTDLNIELPEGKKLYFVSDVHLGFPNETKSRKREKFLIEWLESIEEDAAHIFLLGDIFDFWFDYKHAVPRNYVRLLGKLANLSDKGIQIHYFFGNHDMWLNDYFQKEIGMILHPDDLKISVNHTLYIYMAHGDGLGPGEPMYKIIKKIFRNPISKILYRWIHPDIGIPLARWFSHSSRNHQNGSTTDFLGEDKEHLIVHSKAIARKYGAFDYYIFGHRHHMVTYPIPQTGTYINIGDWMEHYSYAVCDGKTITLHQFNGKSKP